MSSVSESKSPQVTKSQKDGCLSEKEFQGNPSLSDFLCLKIMDIFEQLSKSKFRSRFKLRAKELEYIRDKGLDKIRSHARDFIQKRIAPAEIPNDGKQTPMKGHPVFIAQHATATCCRGCIEKWHKFPKGRELTQEEQDYLVSVIMEWIQKQMC